MSSNTISYPPCQCVTPISHIPLVSSLGLNSLSLLFLMVESVFCHSAVLLVYNPAAGPSTKPCSFNLLPLRLFQGPPQDPALQTFLPFQIYKEAWHWTPSSTPLHCLLEDSSLNCPPCWAMQLSMDLLHQTYRSCLFFPSLLTHFTHLAMTSTLVFQTSLTLFVREPSPSQILLLAVIFQNWLALMSKLCWKCHLLLLSLWLNLICHTDMPYIPGCCTTCCLTSLSPLAYNLCDRYCTTLKFIAPFTQKGAQSIL